MSARSRRLALLAGLAAGVAALGLALPLARALARTPELEVRTVPRRVHAGRLRAEAPLGQRFRCAHDGLCRIEVALADPGPPGTAEVELELRAGGPDGALLRTARTRASAGFVAFDLAPLEDSAGRDLWLALAPAAPTGEAVAARSPWLRYRGRTGAERPWGDRVLAGPVVLDEVLVPHPHLRALALAFEHLPAAPLTVELECAALGLRRTATLVPPAQVDAGWAIMPFEPVPASRWTRWRLRIALPEGARLVGDARGQVSLVTFHRAADADGASGFAELAGLGGATWGDVELADRDLVLRVWTTASPLTRLGDLARALGSALPLGALLWLAAATLSLGALLPRAASGSASSALEDPLGHAGASRASPSSLTGSSSLTSPSRALDDRPSAPRRDGARRGTARLALVAVLLALAHHLLVPPWMGPDEPWQLEVAQYVALGHSTENGPDVDRAELARHPYSFLQVRRRLPSVPFETMARVQGEILASMQRHGFARRVDWVEPYASPETFDDVAPGFTSVNHPPLWPLVASLALRATAERDVETRLRAVRALSGLFYAGIVLATLALARLALDGPAALVAGHLAAWYPVLARASATASIDVLATALVAVAAVLAARVAVGRARRLEPALLAATCVAALATKTTAATSLALAAGALLARAEPPPDKHGPRRRRLVLAVLGLLALAALALWLWARGHNTAVPPDLRALRQRLGASLDPATWTALGRDVVGSFAWGSRAPSPRLVHAVGVVAVLALPGVGLLLARPRARVRRRVLVLALVLLLGQVALVALRGVPSARYVLPAVPAAAVLLAAGHVAAFRGRTARLAALVLLGLAVLWSGWSLWGGAVPAEHLALSS